MIGKGWKPQRLLIGTLIILSMKAALAIAMAVLVAVGAVAGVYLYDHFKVTPSSSGCADPASINSHVYHPSRLKLLNSCITASGIVDTKRNEDDGDIHIGLALDPVYANLTNSGNDQQNGDLVVEIICVNPPTQADAIPLCQNYTNQIPIPDLGEHITVTGPYVLDTNHYNWAEIHPVYSLVQPSLTTGVSITGYVLNIFYPNGATDGWLGPSPRSYATNVIVSGGDPFNDNLTLYSTSPSAQNITSIKVTTQGFSLMSVSPNLPIMFSAGERVSVTLTIQTPDANYDGPINLRIATS